MEWSEIKNLLEDRTGIIYTPINAATPLPAGSYSIQHVRRGPLNESVLAIRVYSEDFEGLLTTEGQLKELEDFVSNTEKYYLHLKMSSSFIYENTALGVYDLAISFLMKWKEKK